MPLLKKCKLCNKEFRTKLSIVNKGWGKYCSRDCNHESSRNGEEIECFLCKKISYKSKRDLSRSKSGKFFCGKSCQTKWRNQEFAGTKHANWKGGDCSYREALIRSDIPKGCKLCGVKDIRILAVHHIDRDRKNNKVENLAWLCHNCHHLVHHHKSEREKFMAAMV